MRQEERFLFGAVRKAIVIVGLIFCLFSSVYAYSGGSGTADDPYQISTVADLIALAANTSDYNENFILTADIDLTAYIFTTAVIAPYNDTTWTGVFDGNGHTINNLTINTGEVEYFGYLGLFGLVEAGGQIKNLGLKNVNVTGGVHSFAIGGLVGQSRGVISNCYSTGNIIDSNTSDSLGGLVGDNGGDISNCYSTSNITGGNNTFDLGGLVGHSGGDIINCYSTGKVKGGNNTSALGGLVGYNWVSNISNCYSTGNVTGGNNTSYFGGLVGVNYGSIRNCYSTGKIKGGNNIYLSGGLVGSNNVSVVNSFWDVNTSGMPISDGGKGKTTVQMQTLSTYTNAGWDFSYQDGSEAIWFMPIEDYPILVWQISPADIYTDGKNNFTDFATFAQYWMRKDCRIYNDYCDFADLNFDGKVDYKDLFILMCYWLEEGIYE